MTPLIAITTVLLVAIILDRQRIRRQAYHQGQCDAMNAAHSARMIGRLEHKHHIVRL